MQLEIGFERRGTVGREPLDASAHPTKAAVLDHVDRLRERLAAVGKRGHDSQAVQEFARRPGHGRPPGHGFQSHMIEDLFVEIVRAQQHQLAELLGRGVVKSDQSAGALVPVLACDAPVTASGPGNRESAEPATIANRGPLGIDFGVGPSFFLGRNPVGDERPLHGPIGAGAMHFEQITIALAIEEHAAHGVGALARVAPAPAIVERERQLCRIRDRLELLEQEAIGLVGGEAGHDARIASLGGIRKSIPIPGDLPAEGREIALGEIGVDEGLATRRRREKEQEREQCRIAKKIGDRVHRRLARWKEFNVRGMKNSRSKQRAERDLNSRDLVQSLAGFGASNGRKVAEELIDRANRRRRAKIVVVHARQNHQPLRLMGRRE